MNKQQTARVEDPETSSGITCFKNGNGVGRRSRTETFRDDGLFFYERQTARGFTLIELLVVVLIIGILAAVALPQYQKAVEKSKATQVFAMIRSAAAAQEAYCLANNEFATEFDQLDVDIPWTGTTRWVEAGKAKSNGDWSLQLYTTLSGKGISVGRISGPYKGAGFIYRVSPGSLSHQITCVERHTGGIAFTKNPGEYCVQILKGTKIVPQNESAATEYLLP